MSLRLDRFLSTLAVVSTLTGGAVLAWPINVRGSLESAPGREPLVTPVVTAGSDSLAEEVAVANVFAATRTPPRRRYAPPESGMGDSASLAPDSAMMTGGGASEAGASGTPALFGTLVNAGGAQALLQLDATLGPRLYATGDRAGGYRVVSIAPRTVVLRGTQGRIVLRLQEEER